MEVCSQLVHTQLLQETCKVLLASYIPVHTRSMQYVILPMFVNPLLLL